MNKPLFWTGVIFQFIHLLALGIFGLFLLPLKIIAVVSYLIFNILTLLMIFIGALSD